MRESAITPASHISRTLFPVRNLTGLKPNSILSLNYTEGPLNIAPSLRILNHFSMLVSLFCCIVKAYCERRKRAPISVVLMAGIWLTSVRDLNHFHPSALGVQHDHELDR